MKILIGAVITIIVGYLIFLGCIVYALIKDSKEEPDDY
jgi:cbb3-type cytochrome oxidase subunit 3